MTEQLAFDLGDSAAAFPNPPSPQKREPLARQKRPYELRTLHPAAVACTEKAEREGFDTEGAGRFILGWLDRHGETSGEELVRQANAHGFRGKDNRCFGAIFKVLSSRKQIRCVRADLPRALGHGTSGGKLWARALTTLNGG